LCNKTENRPFQKCYCANPYSEGFEYSLKMRDKTEQPYNKYEPETLEWFSFMDGYRDGLFTSNTHNLC
jgi:hypothetical protein